MNFSILTSKKIVKLFLFYILINFIILFIMSNIFFYKNNYSVYSIEYFSKIIVDYITKDKIKIDEFGSTKTDIKLIQVLSNRYKKDLKEVLKIINRNKIELLAVNIPNLNKYHRKDEYIYANNLLSNIFKEYQVKYVSLFNYNKIDLDIYPISRTNGHLSHQYNKVVANKIINILKNYKFDINKKRLLQDKIPKGIWKINLHKKKFEKKLFFWTLHTNSKGYLTYSNFTKQSINSKPLVLLIGDSISVPWSTDTDKGFPEIINNTLDLNIINLAKNGRSMKDYKSTLKKYLKFYKPDLIILQTHINDIYNYYFNEWNGRYKYKVSIEEKKYLNYEKNRFLRYLMIYIGINIILIFIIYYLFILLSKKQ